MKKKKRWIIILIAGVLLCLLFLAGFIRINRKYPSPSVETYHLGQPADADGIEVTVLDYKWMDKEEFIEKYPVNEINFLEDSDAKVMMLTVRYKNTLSEKQIKEIYLDTLETLGWSNGVLLDGFMAANPEGAGMYVELDPQEEVEVVLPFILHEVQFQHKTWEKITEEPFGFVISAYPVRRWITIQE